MVQGIERMQGLNYQSTNHIRSKKYLPKRTKGYWDLWELRRLQSAKKGVDWETQIPLMVQLDGY